MKAGLNKSQPSRSAGRCSQLVADLLVLHEFFCMAKPDEDQSDQSVSLHVRHEFQQASLNKVVLPVASGKNLLTKQITVSHL